MWRLSADPLLTARLLHLLADAPEGMALARVCKRLDVRMSVLLRTLAWLGDAELAGQPGPGWVRVERRGEREIAVLAEAGRAAAQAAGAVSP
ncbi:hypothetical protein NB688_001593 [Xanthomonas sacchari]|uniref:HTH iclR-type domain-containing protein n=1 Tax=Xanthomonas sacchari TaxID=56458 RepID=A0ABT3E0I7_9XANT|nr:hypothetical protein [Xanthomonas sacchari]MCW0401213.1 hypothetical protein [Xanthomonas sacchari]MCW0419427.1 hypothetical protein [Xanthomonas sacchari]